MFLICGEALYDLFVEEETPAGLRIDARIGGSPFNVAVGLARLGQRAALLTGVSTDALGDRLAAALDSEGVETRFLARMPNPTTLAVVAFSPEGEPRYTFYGEGAADRSLTATDLQELPNNVSCLHFGSFSLVVDPTASTLLTLAERERERGRRFISLDPNVRANVEPDLARWRDWIERFARTADLVKLSEEDLGHLDPTAEPDRLARAWLDQGARAVVLTRGAEGAALWTADYRVEHPGIAVDVVDTVGAGDAFQAALLCRLDETGHLSGRRDASPPTEAEAGRLLAFACDAAARSCTRRGADFPRRTELPGR